MARLPLNFITHSQSKVVLIIYGLIGLYLFGTVATETVFLVQRIQFGKLGSWDTVRRSRRSRRRNMNVEPWWRRRQSLQSFVLTMAMLFLVILVFYGSCSSDGSERCRTFLDASWFSVISILTIGFGDSTPTMANPWSATAEVIGITVCLFAFGAVWIAW